MEILTQYITCYIMRFDLISISIKRRHNKINTHVMYLIHSSQKTKLYLKQIPNGHDEMATGDHSRKMSSWSIFTNVYFCFRFLFRFRFWYHFVPHFRAFSLCVKAATFCPCQPMYLWAVWFVISQILRVWEILFAKYVIVSCELTDLVPGISQHFVSTVVIDENTQV